jgi:hypothetical protein
MMINNKIDKNIRYLAALEREKGKYFDLSKPYNYSEKIGKIW